jgi:transcriptional regulator with GAF, ATPase, and Fis domain
MQIEVLKSLALSVAQARSPDSVLREMIEGLGMNEGVALARVWLIEREEFSACLRLKASVGRSIARPDVAWDQTEGTHAQLPLDYGKIGRVASTGIALLLQRGSPDWLLQRDWADLEQIQSFAAQPLVFRGEVLGVVAVFSRLRVERRELGWLRVFADHAAVAIANARAFQEIATLKDKLERERDDLRHAVAESPRVRLETKLVAQSPAMQQLLRQMHAVARTESNVLIEGESGVGKELIAAAIHAASARAAGPLVKVNCASVPRELFESEFFGHVRGAFSGASRNREGRFQLAHGGTLFLDEVGEIPLELQGKLLRALQERAFEPVGDDRTRHVDIRVIAATNRDLEAEVDAGRFRLDLFYRLSVFPLEVPPLRARREDILPLARECLQAAAQKHGAPTPSLTPDVECALLEYDFPGNIRELQNILERAVVMQQAGGGAFVLQLGRRSQSLRAASVPLSAAIALAIPSAISIDKPRAAANASSSAVIPAAEFRALERQNILAALYRCEWRVAGERGAAKLLGMKPSTLAYQMKTLGIDRSSAE